MPLPVFCRLSTSRPLERATKVSTCPCRSWSNGDSWRQASGTLPVLVERAAIPRAVVRSQPAHLDERPQATGATEPGAIASDSGLATRGCCGEDYTALSPASSLSLIMCSDASLSSPAPSDKPGGDLVRGHRRPSALSQSGVMGRWWDGVGRQALGGGSWRAVWRRAPRTTRATSRPPALRGAIRYTRSPQYVRYLFRS